MTNIFIIPSWISLWDMTSFWPCEFQQWQDMETQKAPSCQQRAVLRRLDFSGPYDCCRLWAHFPDALALGSDNLGSWPAGLPSACRLALQETFRSLFSLLFFPTYVMENGSLPMMVDGKEGETCKREANRIDFLRSVPTWVFFPLKT